MRSSQASFTDRLARQRHVGPHTSKGEYVLRFEATGHSTKDLSCHRRLDHFAQIIALWPGLRAGLPQCLTARTSGSCSMGCRCPPRQDRSDRQGRPEQDPDPGRPVSGARPSPGLRRVHRRRVHRQGRAPDPAQRLYHPAGRLRPQETPRQGPHGKARPDPPLPASHKYAAVVQESRYIGEYLSLKSSHIFKDALGENDVEALITNPDRLLKEVGLEKIRRWVVYSYIDTMRIIENSIRRNIGRWLRGRNQETC